MQIPPIVQEKLNFLIKEKAECEKSLALYRDLAKTSPDGNKSQLAMTLNKLAIINRTFRNLQESEAQFQEALAIYRELAALQPEIYTRIVAKSLVSMAI